MIIYFNVGVTDVPSANSAWRALIESDFESKFSLTSIRNGFTPTAPSHSEQQKAAQTSKGNRR
jgi:hypothetical protein